MRNAQCKAVALNQVNNACPYFMSANQIPEVTARYFVGMKAVRIEVLDQRGEPVVLGQAENKRGLAVASGFLVSELNAIYLYTCWHVVTGIDMHKPVLPGANERARRATLRITSQDVQPMISDQGDTVGSIVGGEQSITVPLYDTSSTPWIPLWEQDAASQMSKEKNPPEIANLRPPLWHDVVRVKLPEGFRAFQEQMFTPEDFFQHLPTLGGCLMSVGYPYGYSTMPRQPTPIVLTRFVAGSHLDGSRRREVLVDGPGAPGMSGGPVVLFDGGRMFLFGMYTGVLYPDGPREDPERTTALGTVCSFTLMRSLPFAQPLVTVAAN